MTFKLVQCAMMIERGATLVCGAALSYIKPSHSRSKHGNRAVRPALCRAVRITMSNHPNASAPASNGVYENLALEDDKRPTVMNMEPPPPYSGPEPASQMPYPGPAYPGPAYPGPAYPGPAYNGGGSYPPYPGPPMNGGGPYPPYPGPPTNGGGPYPPYPAGPLITNVVLPTATGPRYACGHCQGQFVYHRRRGLAPCPFCHRLSAVGSFIRNRAITYIIIGVIFLLLGIGITVAMMATASWYFVWIGGIIIGIVFVIRGVVMLLTIKTARPISAQPVVVTTG